MGMTGCSASCVCVCVCVCACVCACTCACVIVSSYCRPAGKTNRAHWPTEFTDNSESLSFLVVILTCFILFQSICSKILANYFDYRLDL